MNNVRLLDEKARAYIQIWCSDLPVSIRLKNSRKTKLGDYRMMEGQHFITINNDLPSATLFFVLTHEIAHMLCRIQYGNRIKPHGIEWKTQFGKLIIDSLDYYPLDFHSLLKKLALNPKASFSATSSFLDYNPQVIEKGMIQLKDLKEGNHFKFNKRKFKKGKKRKIRYICTDPTNGKLYTIHGSVVVLPTEERVYEK